MVAGRSTYERWVLTLDAWAKDPQRVSLADLPPLDESTFTADTYRRLIEHLLSAMRQANERWHDGLQRAWASASSPFELGRELVALRVTLARRLQLAQHQGLPAPIRDALLTSLRKDIDRYQQETEDAIRHRHQGASLDTGWTDRMLAVVRENSFHAVLRYDVTGDRPQAPALPERPPGQVTPPARTVRRIVPVRET